MSSSLDASPAISVVIPTFNRPRELRSCLDGFKQQTVGREQFEVVVIDDGSAEDLRPVAPAFAGNLDLQIIRTAHAGPAAARNVGLERARAPLLILYDDDQRPYHDLVGYCLDFHHRHPSEQEALLLRFELDPALSGSTFSRWAFAQLYSFPASACVSGWARFWSGTLTCKKSLFRHGEFDPAYQMLEDAELGLRLSRMVDLRVHFEPRVTGAFIRLVTFEQMWRRQYMLAYFTHALAEQYGVQADFSYPPYVNPEKYLIRDAVRLAAVHAIAATAGCCSIGSAMPHASRLVAASLSTLDLHVRAEAWLDARDGRPATPPGSIAGLMKSSKSE